MKLLLIFVLVGCASATLFEAFERESLHAVNEFMSGLQAATSLHEALGVENTEEIQRFERDIREQLKEHTKGALEEAYLKVIDAVESGKSANHEVLQEFNDIREKMKELQKRDADLENDGIKSQMEFHLRNILEKLDVMDKRTVESQPLQSVLGDLDLRNLLLKLKQMILEKMDPEAVKNSLAKVVGQGAQKLCEWLTNRGKEKVLNFFDRVIDSGDEKKKRATEDHLQDVKDYLENLEKTLEDKASRFKTWLHDLIKKGLDKAEERIQKVKELLNELKIKGRDLTRKEVSDLLDFLLRNGSELKSFYDDLRKINREEMKETA